MHKHAFIGILFFLLPAQVLSMERKPTTPPSPGSAESPTTPRSAALKRQKTNPVEAKGLKIFLLMLKEVKKSKDTKDITDFYRQELKPEYIPFLIPALNLAEFTNQIELKQILKKIIEEKIPEIKNGKILGWCIYFSKKYHCYQELEVFFMQNDTTFIIPKENDNN